MLHLTHVSLYAHPYVGSRRVSLGSDASGGGWEGCFITVGTLFNTAIIMHCSLAETVISAIRLLIPHMFISHRII